MVQHTHQRPWLWARHVHHPTRKASCLLLLQSDNVTAKLYYIETVNTFHHSYSQRILRYALQMTFTFLWNIKTWCSILSWYTKIEQFSSRNVIGPLQYSSHNYSRLHCLVALAQIAEGKKLVEPTEVPIKEEDEVYFLDQEYSGLYDDKVWECIECYLNLPKTSHLD
jgi:hypothetical protein